MKATQQPLGAAARRTRSALREGTLAELPPAKMTPHPPKTRSTLSIQEHALSGLTACVRGYTLTERKCLYELNGEGEHTLKNETVITKTVGADLRAIEFVLTNLCPEKWRSKPSESPSTPPVEEGVELSTLSESALQELAQLPKLQVR